MDHLCNYANHPIAFIVHYLRRHPISHSLIFGAVLAAVACSITTQYGVKFLVDALSSAAPDNSAVTLAFLLLVSLIAADNLLWRFAGWIASYAFVTVSGDLRRDLFRHLTGHAPSYFANRLPGMLTSRITTTSNVVYATESAFIWNVLPPCIATIGAVGLIFVVSVPMALVMSVVAVVMVIIMFRMAAAGKPLHHDFAQKAANVDGEMVDVIGNLPMVHAFSAIGREHCRFDATVSQEVTARRRSLIYLEKLRLVHAVITVVLTIAVLAWALMLWKSGAATTGDVVLVCTLGLSVLHATRDLAVALVDVTQHVARLSEALMTLLLPHDMRDHPDASPLQRGGAKVEFENISFCYPGGRKVFENFSICFEPGQRIGLVGASGSGKSTLLALLQRQYDVQDGCIKFDGQDIARVTQESLRAAISIVPQDTSLFHRSIAENIRYGRLDASDEDVLRAATAAGCDFIDWLPDGFNTMVGDRGLKLSGGQRQRIAIARAFLKDAPVLLLDEATSSLDGESEEIIRTALDRLMQRRTVIAIAHRLSTVRGFDRIVVLDAGRVVQDGPPDTLAQREGLYRELVRREVTRLTRRAA
jgi:ATP-binding cassette, subfamily B, bacterial